MASNALVESVKHASFSLRRLPLPRVFTCRRCYTARKIRTKENSGKKQWEKMEEAKKAWDAKGQRIKAGEEQHLWDKLKERGFVKDVAGDEDSIRQLMLQERMGAYVGIDPTAPSLHIGHLLPLMALFWLYMHGYRTVSLVGGATAPIGDPTGRLTSRDEIVKSDMSMNITKIHFQLKRIWANVELQADRFGYEKEWAWSRALLNNGQWHQSTPFLTIVKRLFKGMRMGPMLSRETAKRKMAEGDGMSLAEFIYPLVQAWDWWYMFDQPTIPKNLRVQMQIGGSDQYGNIISGIDAINHLRDSETNPAARYPDDLSHTPFGFTVPLLTDSSGAKFGKSSGNAVWLDPFMTKPFDLYGYFMRRPDADVESLLKLFTFLPIEDISQIMQKHNEDPSKRQAQHSLAFEVVSLIHGGQEARATQEQHRAVFSRTPDQSASFDPATTQELKSFPQTPGTASANTSNKFRVDIELPESLILDGSAARIIYAAGLADSPSDAHRLIGQQGAYIGASMGTNELPESQVSWISVKNWFPSDTKNYLIGGSTLILRRGKYFVRVVKMVTNEEWEASGKKYPGEPNKGRIREIRRALQEAAGGKDLNFDNHEIVTLLRDTQRLEKEVNSEFLQKEREKRGDQSMDILYPEKPLPAKLSRVPHMNRAKSILQKSELLDQKGGAELTTKEKTEAIDKVISQTRRALVQAKQAAIAARREKKGNHETNLPVDQSNL